MEIKITTVNTGLIALVILVVAIWTLQRGGSVGLGSLKLAGKRLTRRPRKPRPSSPTAQPAPTVQPATRPTPVAQVAADGGSGPLIVVGGLAAVAIVYSLMSVSGQSASGKPRETANTSASAVYAYYAAVSQRDWPQAWKLLGEPTPVYSPGYNQWVSGYACTVHDEITSITPHGDALFVAVRADESGGVVQTYRFRYVVQRGVLTQGVMLSHTGNAPKGCAK